MWKQTKKFHFALCMAVIMAIAGVDGAAAAAEAWNKAKRSELPEIQYGDPIPWETVNEIFPRKTNAQIIDFETGLSFMVQRRAGSRHADVQPLTKEDSRTMKEIYSGKWSWRRRAVLVKVGDRFVAASMNGMPHGAGAISGNNFRGHFCLHFTGSTTHKVRKPDPGHQLMIYKASGKLNDVLATAEPERVVELFFASLKEQDLDSMKLTLDETDKETVEEFTATAAQVENIRIMQKAEGLHHNEQPATTVEIPVRLLVFTRPDNKKLKGEVILRVTRNSPSDRWKVDVKPLLDFLTGKQEAVRSPAKSD